MKIIIVNDARDVGVKAAELVVKEVIKKKNLVLGLATGGTVIPFYRSLVGLVKNKKIDFSYIRSFNLDEYVGLNKKDKRSFYYFMNKNFFSKVSIWMRNVYFLNGMAKNLDVECKEYEEGINNIGGIDLQILGIGRDGHIGFNEPGSSLKSKTREVLLSDITRKDNVKFFSGEIKKVPKRALTMGISTIFGAKKIILLACGEGKAEIVHRFLHGEISEEVPASFLRRHKDFIVILDKEAASELKN